VRKEARDLTRIRKQNDGRQDLVAEAEASGGLGKEIFPGPAGMIATRPRVDHIARQHCSVPIHIRCSFPSRYPP